MLVVELGSDHGLHTLRKAWVHDYVTMKANYPPRLSRILVLKLRKPAVAISAFLDYHKAVNPWCESRVT